MARQPLPGRSKMRVGGDAQERGVVHPGEESGSGGGCGRRRRSGGRSGARGREGGRLVLTEPSQWSDTPLSKRAKSLMKTDMALRMKEMKRCMWM